MRSPDYLRPPTNWVRNDLLGPTRPRGVELTAHRSSASCLIPPHSFLPVGAEGYSPVVNSPKNDRVGALKRPEERSGGWRNRSVLSQEPCLHSAKNGGRIDGLPR